VLVVGSAQSGCQIAEDLADAGRKVYLATSKVGRLPRRYRGKDINDWIHETGFYGKLGEIMEGVDISQLKTPQLTGVGEGRRTISLQSLARKGVVILGKLRDSDQKKLFFHLNAGENIAFADFFSAKTKDFIDEFILINRLEAPPSEEDINDIPDAHLNCTSLITSLDTDTDNISSIIWATGFTADFNYIKLPVLTDIGQFRHHNGISYVDGLYCAGLFHGNAIYGIKENAQYIVERVCQYAGHSSTTLSQANT
jgi:putative flavoprotein involved in K+ transport